MSYKHKSILLVEVVVVLLLVSIASLFLFRGYSMFLKASTVSGNYLHLLLFLEEKYFKLNAGRASQEIEARFFSRDEVYDKYRWGLTLEDTAYPGLKQGVLKAGFTKSRQVLDTVVYFINDYGA